MSSASGDDRERVVFLSFWAVETFFSCVLYDTTIILCCLLGFRALTPVRMIEEWNKMLRSNTTLFQSVKANATWRCPAIYVSRWAEKD